MGPCPPLVGAVIAGVFGGMQVIFYQDYLGLSAKWITIAATIYAIWKTQLTILCFGAYHR